MRIILLCFLLTASYLLHAQRECASRSYLQSRFSEISVAGALEKAEKFISAKEAFNTGTQSTQESSAAAVIRIPVVIHIIYNTASQNISDEQVRSQIAALNRDFRRKNADTSNTPERFRSVAADAGIEFFLATADPYGGPTNGIVRKQTTVADWSADDKVKFAIQGGSNAWDSRSYLNIWVCNLRRITGYSSAPGSPTQTDGIVIGFSAFGNGSAPYNMGRTAVHEVGHWLGLKHIWGDSYCGDDGIDDTPQQGNFTPGCPTGFRSSCNNGTTGDMYMNFMDFTYDACINLFTIGQKNRMRACFSEGGPRNSLLFSKGLNQPWTEGGQAEDIRIESKPELTIYPNPVVSELKVKLDAINATAGEIRIVNMNGVNVMRSKLVAGTHTFNLSSLPSGQYMVIIYGGEKVQSRGFVKL
jgi:hypothetical protein